MMLLDNIVTAPKHIPLLLFKITRKEYIEDIINNGRFYLTQAEYFRKMALQNPESYIYDIDECSHSRQLGIYLKSDADKYYMPIFSPTVGHAAVNANQCLFCTYCPNRHFSPDWWNEEKGCYICRVPSEVIEEICNGNCHDDYAVLLFEYPSKTLDKIDGEMNNMKITGGMGYVGYDDHDFVPLEDTSSPYYGLEAAFHKNKRYQSQNEYRIVALNSSLDDITTLRIGPLDEDEYTVHEIQANKDMLIEIYPYINERISATEYRVSIEHVEVHWDNN